MSATGGGEPLTEREEDFLAWMEDLDLEEVNLLGQEPPPRGGDAFGRPAAQAGGRLDGAAKPEVLPARDTGWQAD